MASFSKSGVNVSDNTTLLLVGGALAIAYFGIIKPVTNAVGLTKSSEDKQTETAIEINSKANGWNPNYYKSLQGRVRIVLTTSITSAIAKKIYLRLFPNAFFLNDDEEAVYAALRQMKSQADLSYLSYTFYNMYKSDLYTYIKSCFSTKEMAMVSKITSSLPNYIKAK